MRTSLLNEFKNPGIQILNDAIRVLLMPDDNCILASQVS
jgi:hypothetical protein